MEYDPKKVSVSINGVIQTGLAGSFISASTASDNITPTIGVKGDVAVAKSANKSGTVTITYLHTSASLAKITALSNAVKKFPLLISDTNVSGKVRVSAADCYIQKAPDLARGAEVGEVAVTVFVPSLVMK
jgi:hypothetical protein